MGKTAFRKKTKGSMLQFLEIWKTTQTTCLLKTKNAELKHQFRYFLAQNNFYLCLIISISLLFSCLPLNPKAFLQLFLKAVCRGARASGQGGDIRTCTACPRTTKRRITTNLNTNNNQNCQKIKLYGSPTTKELKKSHSPNQVGGEEMQRCMKM